MHNCNRCGRQLILVEGRLYCGSCNPMPQASPMPSDSAGGSHMQAPVSPAQQPPAYQQPPVQPSSTVPDSDGWQRERQPSSPNSAWSVTKIIASIIGFVGFLVAVAIVLYALLT